MMFNNHSYFCFLAKFIVLPRFCSFRPSLLLLWAPSGVGTPVVLNQHVSGTPSDVLLRAQSTASEHSEAKASISKPQGTIPAN